MNNLSKLTKIFCIICVILMLGVLILQYVPYWSCSDDGSSIADYVWWPDQHKKLTNEFRSILGRDYEVQQMVLMPVTVFIACILGITLSIIKPGKIGTFIFPFIAGAMGLYGFLVAPVFSLGSIYVVQIIASATLLVASIIGGVISVLIARQMKK